MTDAERALLLIGCEALALLLREHEHAREATVMQHMIETVVAEADAAEMENGR